MSVEGSLRESDSVKEPFTDFRGSEAARPASRSSAWARERCRDPAAHRRLLSASAEPGLIANARNLSSVAPLTGAQDAPGEAKVREGNPEGI